MPGLEPAPMTAGWTPSRGVEPQQLLRGLGVVADVDVGLAELTARATVSPST